MPGVKSVIRWVRSPHGIELAHGMAYDVLDEVAGRWMLSRHKRPAWSFASDCTLRLLLCVALGVAGGKARFVAGAEGDVSLSPLERTATPLRA